MLNDIVPTEEEFDVVIRALTEYTFTLGNSIANEEVLKATARLSTRAKKEMSDNEKAFQVFNPEKQDGAETFVSDLLKELDQEGLKKRIKDESEKLTILGAKMIRLRDECRKLRTNNAIEDLLK